MSKRAFLVGVGIYSDPQMNLDGPPNDVDALSKILSRNEDGSINYECLSWKNFDQYGQNITRDILRQGIVDLFDHDGDVLFYYSGHGYVDKAGGYLITHDGNYNGLGLSMSELVNAANASRAKSVMIILDCCHSGAIGNSFSTGQNSYSLLCENHVLMAASRAHQVAMESDGRGHFTSALVDALDGGAVDHEGWITAPSVYTYIARRFGAWDQTPVFKANLTDTVLLRRGAPLIEREKLLQLTKIFPDQDYKFQLDPAFEPEDEHGNMREPVDQEKIALALLFKDYRDAGLLRPTPPISQLYWAARKNGTVELTLRGKEQWRLVHLGRT